MTFINRKFIVFILLLQLPLNQSVAGKKQHFFNTNIEYDLNAHFSIGGSTPLGMPIEIREIITFNPDLQLGLGTHATKWLENTTGIRLGLNLNTKGMQTKARVRNYKTEIIIDKLYMEGVFTGLVETQVKNTYLTFPLSLVHKPAHRWAIYAGPQLSFNLNPHFSGYVSDGVFRLGDSTGEKFDFDENSQAAYDFSDSIRNLQWGMHFGGEWSLKKHLILFTYLEYDFNNLFQKGFRSITFSMHNIYLNFGFGYRF